MTETQHSHFILCVHSLPVRHFLLSAFNLSPFASFFFLLYPSFHPKSLHSLRTFPHVFVRSPFLLSPFSSSFPLFRFTSFSFLLPSPPFAPPFAPQSTIVAVLICSIGRKTKKTRSSPELKSTVPESGRTFSKIPNSPLFSLLVPTSTSR